MHEREEEIKNEIEISHLVFSILRKASATLRVDFTTELETVCYALLYFGFREAGPIPYIQAGILNMTHPYLLG